MTEEQRKQAYAEMERRMAMSHLEVEIPVKQAPDRSAMQAIIEQVYQEKEIPQPVLPKPIPVVEQPKSAVELPKPPVSLVTVEAPVVPPVVQQRVVYSQPLKQSPPPVKPVLPIEKEPKPSLQPTLKKSVNWAAWVMGLFLLAVIAEVTWLLIS